jgi:hypothetical protein
MEGRAPRVVIETGSPGAMHSVLAGCDRATRFGHTYTGETFAAVRVRRLPGPWPIDRAAHQERLIVCRRTAMSNVLSVGTVQVVHFRGAFLRSLGAALAPGLVQLIDDSWFP